MIELYVKIETDVSV